MTQRVGISERYLSMNPEYVKKQIEFRTGDGTCNYYLAMSALLMAGLDGIKNRILPDDEIWN